jgi:hypothetical protein
LVKYSPSRSRSSGEPHGIARPSTVSGPTNFRAMTAALFVVASQFFAAVCAMRKARSSLLWASKSSFQTVRKTVWQRSV